MAHKKVNVVDRFYKYVDKNGPVSRIPLSNCWIWIGCVDRDNYGQFALWDDVSQKRSLIKAHRMAYSLEVGPLDKSKVIRHLCGNPKCVRYQHIQLGSHKENAQDSIDHGTKNPSFGESHTNSKLTNTDVVWIRYAKVHGFSALDLSVIFDMNVRTIWKVIYRETWRHVT